MQDSVVSIRQPLVEPSWVMSQPAVDTSWFGYSVGVAGTFKAFLGSLSPSYALAGDDTDCAIGLKAPSWQSLKELTLGLTEAFVPAGRYLQALRCVCSLVPLTAFMPVAAGSVIEVPDAQTLAKIGNDPSFPLSGRYRQTGSIDASGLKPIADHARVFSGQYDGGCQSVTNLTTCLFGEVRAGFVSNLLVQKASIVSAVDNDNMAVVACKVNNNGRLSNILVEDSVIAASGKGTNTGIAAGSLRGGHIENLAVRRCKVLNYGSHTNAGVGVGYMDRGTLADLDLVDCSVQSAGKPSNIGIGAGQAKSGSRLNNIQIIGGGIVANASESTLGGAVGRMDGGRVDGRVEVRVDGVRARHFKMTSNADRNTEAGLGAGIARHASLRGLEANDVTIVTYGDGSHAALGVALATEKTRIESPLTRGCSVQTYGREAVVGIGAGRLIGTGRLGEGSIVDGVLGDNCTLGTQGNEAHGGFGAGYAGQFSGVINTVVINSRLRVNDSSAKAGIGVGTIDDTLVRVGGSLACNTTVNDKIFVDGCGLIDLRALVNSSNIQPGHHRCAPALPEPTTPPVVLPDPATTSSVVLPGPATSSVVLPEPATTSVVLPEPATSSIVLPEPVATSIVLQEPATPSLVEPAPVTASVVLPAPTSPAVVVPGLDVLSSAPPVSTVVLPEPATPSVMVPVSATPSAVMSAPTSPAVMLPGLGVLPSAPPVSTVVLPEPATPSVKLPEPATPSVVVPASASPSVVVPAPATTSVVLPAPTTPAVVLPGLDVLPSAPPVPTIVTMTDVVPPGVSLLSPTVVSILLATGFTAALGGLACYLLKRGSGRQTGADGSQGRENGSGTGSTVRHSEDRVMV